MRISVLRLMLWVRVVSLSSMVSVRSFKALVKSRSDTSGEDAAVLDIAWAFWAITSRTGAWASRMAVELGATPSILPLCGTKSTLRPSK